MEEIKTYPNIIDENGDLIQGLRVLNIPFDSIEDDGVFYNYTASTGVYAQKPSVVLIIDENTMMQLEKLLLLQLDGKYKLFVKENEIFTYPIETEQEREIRELKEKLAALEAAQHEGE
ncbi:hypothetical protein [Mammaliicoccus sp. E-M24]|uniref:hypothetical protein n=1 Tax=Mammaliicoccus sp. E-M24 TaxID=2898684 RepID=UPI001EFBA9FE|nr:hypothetical protein [Mammaliicoccus sp. E-M24]